MSANYLLVLLLFPLIFKTGLSAEISVFVQTGDSVQLDIQTQELPQFDDLSWRNSKSDNIVRCTIDSKRVKLHPSYKDRVDFNDKTFSLTLKNMQETDSGLYIARVSGNSDKDIVTYRVSVIDAVEAPVLTVNSNASSSDSCSVNFTCSAQEFMINSTYQNNRCSPEEVTSQINTLILNCSEESITCNHSNPVSWKEVRMSIKELCINNENDSSQVQIGSPFLWPVVGSVAVFVLICFLAFLYIKCKKGDQEQVGGDSTLYAQVETMQQLNSDCHTYDSPERVQVQPQEKTEDKTNTFYCKVGDLHTSKPPGQECTIYSAVCKQPNKKPPADS